MSIIIDTVTSESCEIQPMSLLGKDHKVIIPGELPKCRAVMSGCKSMGVHFTNLNSDILEPLASILGRENEFMLTEDLLNKTDVHNDIVAMGELKGFYEGVMGTQLEEPGNLLTMLAVDCVAMFPRLTKL